MSFLIAGMLEVFSWTKRNSKLLFWLFLFYMWMLFWGNHSSPDHLNYEWMYCKIQYISMGLDVEIGYKIIMILAKKIGLSSTMFFAIFSAFGYILFSRTILKYALNPAMVASLYFLFPFLLDAEQKRSFIGFAIIISAIPQLVKGTKSGIVNYIICCIFATAFQTSCIIFLLYLFSLFDLKTIKKITFIVIVVLLNVKRILPVFSIFIPAFAYNKFVGYVYAPFLVKNIISIIFFLLILGLGIYLCNLFIHTDISEKYYKFYVTIMKINILSLAFLPLVYLSDDFTRLPRAIMILNYIVITNAIKKKITKKKEFIIMIFIICTVGSRFITYFFGGGLKSYIIPFFIEGSNF